MSSRLEQYVDDLGSQLGGLSPEQRAAEISEVRGHLDALVEGHRELGLDADAAEAAAVRQFGDPRRVSRGVHLAALQRLLDNPLGAAAALIVLGAVVRASLALILPVVWGVSAALGETGAEQASRWFQISSAFNQFFAPAICGVLLARWLPRAAVRGAFLVVLLTLPAVLTALLSGIMVVANNLGVAYWILVPLVSVVFAGATQAVRRQRIA